MGPDRMLRLLLAWTALTTLFFWLPTVRGPFDGPSYQWGLFGLGGRGTSGDYWVPLLGSTFTIAVQVLGWRGARAPFHVLLAGWHLLLASGVAYLGFSDPEGFRLQGDTLGIDIPLTWVGLLLYGIPAALACLWSWRDLRRGPRAPAARWQPATRSGSPLCCCCCRCSSPCSAWVPLTARSTSWGCC